MNFTEAYTAAFRRYSACALVHTRLKGFQVVDLDGDALMGDVYFISDGNMASGGHLMPVHPNAELTMATVIFEALGGPEWDTRTWEDPSDEVMAKWDSHNEEKKQEAIKQRERAKQIEASKLPPKPVIKKLKRIKPHS